MHLRLLTLFLIAVGALQAQRVTLYLKGGGDMLVREYEVQEDRVRYYSLERSQWEEIPLELVDLEKTKQTAERAEKRRESMRRESAKVPSEPQSSVARLTGWAPGSSASIR